MASAALQDFARRPTGYKAAVFGGVLAALGGLYFQFGYKPMSTEITEARNNAATMAKKKTQLEADEVAFREMQTKMVALKRLIDENQKALPTGAELPAFFDTLNRKVNEAGVEIRKWEYKSDLPVDAFVKVPVEIELTGTFFQLKRFFASLVQRGVSANGSADQEERERIVTIENLQLTNPTVRNREVVLTAKFTASTFRQDDDGGAADGAPAKGGASGSAKSKVEDATRKQDERNRKGLDEDGAGAKGADRMKGGI
jgi:type IV pilus assembly protein PilO